MKIIKMLIAAVLLILPNVLIAYGRTYVDSTDGTFDYTTRTMRQVFYTKGYHFVFYVDNDDRLVYRISPDGIEFSEEILLAENIWSMTDYSMKLDDEKDIHLVYSAAQSGNKPQYTLYYQQGRTNESGIIDWFRKVQVSFHPADTPFITLNSLGRPVIAYRSRFDKNFQFIVAIDEEGSSWSEPVTFHSWESVQPDYYPAVHELAYEDLLLIYWDGKTDRVYSVHWNGTDLSDPEEIYNCFDFYMNKSFFYYCWSGLADKNYNVYFSNPVGNVIRYNQSSKAWGLERRMKSKWLEVIGGLAYDEENDRMYLVVLNLANYEVQYYLREDNEWTVDATTIIKLKEPIKIASLICSEEVNDRILSLRWFEGEGDTTETLDLYFAGVDLSKPVVAVPEILIKQISVIPEQVQVGEAVNISITLVNNGTSKAKDEVLILLNGSAVENLQVTLEGSEEKTLEYELNTDNPGLFNVTVRDKTGFFKVEDPPQKENEVEDEETGQDLNLLYPSLLAVVLVVVVLVYVYYKRSK